jgi:hypothetical protein
MSPSKGVDGPQVRNWIFATSALIDRAAVAVAVAVA